MRGVRRALVLLLACAGGARAQAPVAADPVFPLHTDGTRLVDSAGREFRVVGDAAWTIMVGLTASEAGDYLSARRAAGFNTVLVEMVERGHAGPADRDGNLPFPADTPFRNPSPAYFRHVRAVLDLARAQGFLVLLSPAYVGYRCDPKNWCDALRRASIADLEAWGRAVGELTAGLPNIIWVHGGDVDARTYGVTDRVEAVYRGIAAVQPAALHTAHCSRNFSAIDCYERLGLDINTTYSDCELTPHFVRLDRLRAPAMPSIYIEGRYEEERSTPLCVRSQLWWSFLGGSVGHVFGNKRIWRFDPDWRDALATPGTRSMTVASRLLARLDGSEVLEPVGPAATPLRVSRGPSAARRLATWPVPLGLAWATLTAADDRVPVAGSTRTTVAYLPWPTRFEYWGHHPVRCWIHPVTGAIRAAAGDPATLSSPDRGDWLFVAEASTRVCSGDQL